MTDIDDAALVARCRSGDDAAFRELVDRYKDLVFGLIARTVDDRARAEDLAQETFLRVYRGLPYFRGEARLSTWIYRIALNLCIQTSTPARAIEYSLDETDSGGRRRLEPAVDDAAFTEIELRDRLGKAMAKLPARYRILVAAHYLGGIRYDDLAEALNVPVGTIKTQLFRAKRQLRLLLESDLR